MDALLSCKKARNPCYIFSPRSATRPTDLQSPTTKTSAQDSLNKSSLPIDFVLLSCSIEKWQFRRQRIGESNHARATRVRPSPDEDTESRCAVGFTSLPDPQERASEMHRQLQG